MLSGGFWYTWSLVHGEPGFGIDIPNKKAVLFDDGTARMNTSTLARYGETLAALLSLPVAKQADGGPALEDWRNKPVYFSSFLVSQRDMLDSVQRVTGTKDADWVVEKVDAKERVEEGLAAMKKGDYKGFVRAMYTRTFYRDEPVNFEAMRGLHNEVLGLEKEDLDTATKQAVDEAVSKE